MQLRYLASDEAILVAGGLLVAGAVGWGMRSYYKNKPTPSELERRRRSMLNAYGKMGDASVIEIQGNVAIYSYDVRGVEYTAAQDFSLISVNIPEDTWSMVGPASVKYDPRNPANSIIISEKWSGIRPAVRKV